jgi:hypothetical protein
VNNLQRLPYGERRTPRAPEDVEKDLQKSAQDVASASADGLHALVESITRNLISIEFEAFNIKYREPFADDVVVTAIAAHFDHAISNNEEPLTISLLRLIANLVSKHSEIQQLFIAKDVHDKLLHLLEEQGSVENANPQLTSALAVALGSLCANNKGLQEQVHKSKAFPVIAKLVASDDIVIQIEVYQALQNIISGNEDVQEELVKKYDVLDRIAKILSGNTSNKNKEDQNKLLQSVTGLIGAIVAGNDKLQRVLRKEEILSKLLAMVDIFKNNNKVVAFVLEALSEACRENSQNQDAVFSLHLVPILVAYLTSSSALLQAKSAELIGLLASKSSRRKENFRQANAIDALQSLTLSTENEQVPLIAQMTLNVLQADK